MKRLSIVAVVAAAIALTAAGNAYADALAHYWGSGGNLRATATFESYGEVLRVCDNAADGHSAVAQLEYYIPENAGWDEWDRVWATSGNGTCNSMNLSMNENLPVRLRACIGEAGTRTIIACGNWGYTEALMATPTE